MEPVTRIEKLLSDILSAVESGGGGGGGGGTAPLVITVTCDEHQTYHADKTPADIRAAVLAGTPLLANTSAIADINWFGRVLITDVEYNEYSDTYSPDVKYELVVGQSLYFGALTDSETFSYSEN